MFTFLQKRHKHKLTLFECIYRMVWVDRFRMSSICSLLCLLFFRLLCLVAPSGRLCSLTSRNVHVIVHAHVIPGQIEQEKYLNFGPKKFLLDMKRP